VASALFSKASLSGLIIERCFDLGKVLDMSSEEVAETKKLSHFMHIIRWLSVSHGLELVSALCGPSGHQPEPQVADLHCSEEGFWEVDLQSMFSQSNEELLKNLQVLVVIFGVKQQIIDVGQDVGEVLLLIGFIVIF
jgi:hypothetical protein